MAKKQDKTQTADLNEQDGNDGMGATPAANSLKTTETSFTRSELMSDVLIKLSDMPHEDLSAFLHKALEVSAKYSKAIPDGSEAKNKATIDTKPSLAGTGNLTHKLPGGNPGGNGPGWEYVKEDLSTLFGDNGLPEEIRPKIETLFEAAVNLKFSIEKVKMEEDFDEKFNDLNEQLVAQLDDYLNYAAEEWLEENRVAVESSIHVELVNNFMDALKNVFTEHYIEVPTDRVDVVEELAKQIDELQGKLDEEVAKRLEAEKYVQAAEASSIFDKISEGLALTQVEKLKTLTESIDFDGDTDSFVTKLVTIRDAHFEKTNKKPAKGVLSEEVARSAEEWKEIDEAADKDAKPASNGNVNPRIARYVEKIQAQELRGRRGALT